MIVSAVRMQDQAQIVWALRQPCIVPLKDGGRLQAVANCRQRQKEALFRGFLMKKSNAPLRVGLNDALNGCAI